MPRMILFLLIIYLSSFLSAQNVPASPLDLGDIIIEGETDLIKDSLGTNYDLDSLLKVDDKTKFHYKPEPVLESTPKQVAYARDKLLSLELKGGNYTFGSCRAALSASYLANFNFTLFNHSLGKKWHNFESGLNWLPSYRNFNFNAGISFLDHESPIIETAIEGLNLGITRSGFSAENKIDFPAFNISAFNYRISQINEELTSLDVRSNINWDISIFKLRTSLEYLKENFQGDLTLFMKGLPVNKLGLYLQYRSAKYAHEKAEFAVSVDLFTRINLLKSLFLNISNEPYQTKKSYLDDLKNYKFSTFTENSNQFSALINPQFSLEYFGPFYLKGSFRFSMLQDYYFFVPDSLGFYKITGFAKVERQELGLDFSYKIAKMEVGNNLIFTRYEVNDDRINPENFSDIKNNIPYQPELENIAYFTFTYSNWKLRAENNSIIGREDEFGLGMPDLNLVNVYLSYLLFEQFEIIGEVENMLNKKYLSRSYLPEQGLQFKAGFRWTY
ncbi:MAG: hypothetical protein APR54_00440 [Candidatus Cloacimonas sp. SDB]|nr:MAG: hypothetical protein APR54_00440 [Candidatus Cloacimonas sp. SDB]